MRAMTSVGIPATQATQPATVVDTTETSAVTTPRTVAGATNGAANRFAATPITEMELCNRTITGIHMSWAATGTANAGPHSRMRLGSSLPTARPHGLAKSRSPSVARVDSTNPADR